jgi:shikimate kinase
VVPALALDGPRMNKPVRIVELIGLAGAGKSTIAERLPRHSDRVVVEELPYFRRLQELPFFSVNTLLSLPGLISQAAAINGGRWLSRDEILWMVLLQGWHRRLMRRAADGDKVILLDQGPVFLLMELDLFGPARIKWPKAKHWWLRTTQRWAGVIDAAIWLDAPDEILVRRIRARQRWHGVKERSDSEAIEYLCRYRVAFEKVVSMLAESREDIRVVRINTGAESPQQTVRRVLSILAIGNNRSNC